MKNINTNTTSFESSKSHINWLKLPFYLMAAILISQLIMYLDDALIAAYVLCPYIIIQMWASDSKIKWNNNKRHFLTYISTILIIMLSLSLFVLEVLYFEENSAHSINNHLLNNAVEFIANQNKN